MSFNLFDMLLLLLLAGAVFPIGYYAHGVFNRRFYPQVKDVEPVRVRRGMDRILLINGTRFDRWSRVAIDGKPVAAVRFVTAQRLQVQLPFNIANGAHAVSVTDFRQRTAVLNHAFEVVEPPPPAAVAEQPPPVAVPVPVLLPSCQPAAAFFQDCPAPQPPQVFIQPVVDEVYVRVVLFEMNRRMIDVLQQMVESGKLTDDGLRIVGVRGWGSMPAETTLPVLSGFAAAKPASSKKTQRSRGTVWAVVDLELGAEVEVVSDRFRAAYRDRAVDTGTVMHVTIDDARVPCLIASAPRLADEPPPPRIGRMRQAKQ